MTIARNQCLACNSRSCYTRIYTADLRYDEVSCDEHIRDLEKHSDSVLGTNNGVMRNHLSSTSKLRRATCN